MSNLVESLKGCSDSIFEIRGKLGAALKPVYIVTRVWSGRSPGEGTFRDSEMEVLPVPGIKDLAHDRRVMEGGTAKEGDLVVYHISKHKYPLEETIDCRTPAKNIEKFYRIGTEFYRAYHIHERYLSWDVWIRRVTDQRKS
jgi:hypothetical protein